jgi:hypothetical protein
MTIHRFLDQAEISYLAQDSVQIWEQVGHTGSWDVIKRKQNPSSFYTKYIIKYAI